ncbi:MAG: 3-hydroxyacyl-CoA dehydrogenase NAD-binding domain-containing protein [Paracoccaceae bacterium]
MTTDAGTSPVTYERRGGIGVIVIDSPPVNALGAAVRRGLTAALEQGLADDGARALVVAGAGRTFTAGADIREFGKPPVEPSLPDVITTFERAEKIVVAAIHGNALGGGLELALGCDYRVASADAKVGLPEVKLGILPGAGGTQRLPRLIGPDKALDVIVGGAPIPAAKAKTLGILDEIADGDVVGAAVAFAERLVAEGAPRRPVAAMDAEPPAPDFFETAEAETRRRKRGMEAPLKCIEAVRAASETAFDEGLAIERRLFVELRDGAQSKALRHVFFAEREVAKVPGLAKDTPKRTVERAAVIGAGTMGGGIAMCFAGAGIPVTLLEVEEKALERGVATVRRNYEATAKKGRISAEDVEQRMGLIAPALDYKALGEADLVIEAVFEDMEVKKRIFSTLDSVCKQDAVLATNTSTLDIDAIASATSRPGDVVGMHFFSSANVMRLLEVVRGRETAPETLATAMETGRKLGKVSVAVGNCHGFVGNRMLHKRQAEAMRLVEEGANPEDVDRVLVAFGLPMGPFAMTDLAGLDVGWRIREAQRKAGAPDAPARNWLDALAEQGRHGQKTGAGVYAYEEGGRTPTPDPKVAEIIAGERARKGVNTREIGDDEILKRCLHVMVNEGARILEEGIAPRALDIDTVWINGYGFPAWRGGPMFWADEDAGLATIRDYCAGMHDATGLDVWRPAALLDRLAREGGRFADLEGTPA